MSTSSPTKIVQAYLDFDGRCEEAVEFYRQALGAEVEMLVRFKESPEPHECAAGSEDKIMHASFRIGETQIMASDCHCQGSPAFQGFSLSSSVATEAEADQYFNALAEGGKVEMPLEKTFWSPRFGVVSDRFGVRWMINVIAEHGGC